MTREYRLKKLYGITLSQYQELLTKQNNSCAVCLRPETAFKQNLSVDHNHTTLEIRGLLCTYCNRRIVGRHKTGFLLRQAADYLDVKGTGWFTPIKKRKRKK